MPPARPYPASIPYPILPYTYPPPHIPPCPRFVNVLALRDDGNELKLVQSVDMPSGTPARAPPSRGRHYMIQPLVELYGECMVVFKVS